MTLPVIQKYLMNTLVRLKMLEFKRKIYKEFYNTFKSRSSLISVLAYLCNTCRTIGSNNKVGRRVSQRPSFYIKSTSFDASAIYGIKTLKSKRKMNATNKQVQNSISAQIFIALVFKLQSFILSV